MFGIKKCYLILLILGLTFPISNLYGQKIEGKIVDFSKDIPLSYVNIGVINMSRGTVTDEFGNFQLDCKDLPEDSQIRISMIGYKPQTFLIRELLGNYKKIKLERKLEVLDEIIIKWRGETRKVGTIKVSKGGICGWGGTSFAKGHELGLLLKLGSNTVKIEDLNIKIYKQSFDTVMFRLHIRSLKNNFPSKELLTENIYLNISNANGWQKIYLSDNNILIKDSVVLTLEWLSASNIINKKAIRVNGKKDESPKILFNVNNKRGTFYIRNGSEAKWRIVEGNSPGFYVTVTE